MKTIRQLSLLIVLICHHPESKASIKHMNKKSNTCSIDKSTSPCNVTVSGHATCKLLNISHLQQLLEGRNVTHLDLAHNCLRSMPRKSFSSFSRLIKLSLAFNRIQVLNYNSFEGLDALKLLNLTKNPLRTITGNLIGLLPSLNLLDLTGVTTWNLDKQLFRLPMLTKILGFSLSKNCTNCVLFIPYYHKNIKFQFTRQFSTCYKTKRYNLTSVIPRIAKLTNGTLFQLACKNPSKCAKSETNKTILEILEMRNICWKDALVMLKVQGVFGMVGLVLNLLVFLNIATSKKLRKNVSMLFVCNMGFSDFLLSAYTVSITVYLTSFPFNYLYHSAPENNWKIGWVWMLGQAGSVITSFFLTLERYLVIVYSMKPELRISSKAAHLMLLFCWLIAFFFTGYALYFNFYSKSFLCVPIRLSYVFMHAFVFTMVLGNIGLFLYFLSFCLYAHIYIVAKRAAQNAGVSRESKMAKRIFMLVFSNIFFFIFPIILIGFLTLVDIDSVTTSSIVVTSLFVGLNSCVNPVVHAFRNDRFNQVFKCNFQYVQDLFRSIVSKRSCCYRGRVFPQENTGLQHTDKAE